MGILLLLALVGCKKVEPVDPDLDATVHFLWREGQDAAPRDLLAAVDDMHRLLGNAILEEPVDGSTDPLGPDDVSHLRDTDPSRAVGLFLASEFPCTAERVRNIHIDPRQDELYDGFDDYRRTFTTDRDAFVEGHTDALSWDATYTVSIPLAGPYTAMLDGRIRRVFHPDRGEVYLSRSWLVEPARFEKDGQVFDQDYRFELFYAPRQGRIRHVEGLWRNMNAGPVDIHKDGVQRLVLNGLADWDARTAEWCEKGLP